MKYKFFAISARNPETEEAALNSFCSQQRVTFVEKQLISDGAQSFWSVCVTYEAGEGSANPNKDTRKPRVDYKKVLSEDDFTRYLELHALRKQIAERQAVPAYAIFTNEQLAAMIQKRIITKAGLEAVENIGQKRVELYGEEFLKQLTAFWEQNSQEKLDETPQDNA